MIKVIRAFLDFCYIARRNVHTTKSLRDLDDALARYHTHCTIFQDSGLWPEGFNLPRQHFLLHYHELIREFGAPNGLCLSITITESKHIKAVKELWCRSNRCNALGQMLVTNQRLDKLAAARVDFCHRRMLQSTSLDWALSRLGMTNYWSILILRILTLYFCSQQLMTTPVMNTH